MWLDFAETLTHTPLLSLLSLPPFLPARSLTQPAAQSDAEPEPETETAVTAAEKGAGPPVLCSHAEGRIWLIARSSRGQTHANTLPHKHQADQIHHNTCSKKINKKKKQSLIYTTETNPDIQT